MLDTIRHGDDLSRVTVSTTAEPARPARPPVGFRVLGQHQGQAPRLGEAGRERLMTEFDYEVMLQRTLSIFQAALQRSRPAEASAVSPMPLVAGPASTETALTGQGTEGR